MINIILRFAQTKAEVTVVNFSPGNYIISHKSQFYKSDSTFLKSKIVSVAQEISYDFYHTDSAVVTDLEMTIDSYTFKGYTTKAATAAQVCQLKIKYFWQILTEINPFCRSTNSPIERLYSWKCLAQMTMWSPWRPTWAPSKQSTSAWLIKTFSSEKVTLWKCSMAFLWTINLKM